MKRTFANASGLLVGASDPDTGDGGYAAAFTLGTVNGVAPSGGTINTTIAGVGTVFANASTGAFDFDPAPGVTGNVSFNYTICDSGNPAPSACSAPATVTFNISGWVIWFVDDSAPAGGAGACLARSTAWRRRTPSMAPATASSSTRHVPHRHRAEHRRVADRPGGDRVRQLRRLDDYRVHQLARSRGRLSAPALSRCRYHHAEHEPVVKALALSTGPATGMTDPAGPISGVS